MELCASLHAPGTCASLGSPPAVGSIEENRDRPGACPGPTRTRTGARRRRLVDRLRAVDVGSTSYAAAALAGDVVYPGGDFTGVVAGMPEDTYRRIARWDGVAWARMGDGLERAVRTIAVAGGSVVVGGEFSVAGATVAAARLARWDGQQWSALGGGVSRGVDGRPLHLCEACSDVDPMTALPDTSRPGG